MSVGRPVCVDALVVAGAIEALVVGMAAPALVELWPCVTADRALIDDPVVEEVDGGACGVADGLHRAIAVHHGVLGVRHLDDKRLVVLHGHREGLLGRKGKQADEHPVSCGVALVVERQNLVLRKAKRIDHMHLLAVDNLAHRDVLFDLVHAHQLRVAELNARDVSHEGIDGVGRGSGVGRLGRVLGSSGVGVDNAQVAHQLPEAC